MFVEDEWKALHARLGLTVPPTALAELLRHWSAPGRHYHAVSHLEAGLRALRGEGPQADLVRLTWFFHDVVYVTGRTDNEAVSAQLFERHARASGLGDEFVRRGAQLILLTRDHQGAVTNDPLWPLMNDTDLGIFAATRAMYDRYTEGVWREYAAVYDRKRFVIGRAAFMTAFAARPIFLTPVMRPREPAARANIAAEVARLQAEARRNGWSPS